VLLDSVNTTTLRARPGDRRDVCPAVALRVVPVASPLVRRALGHERRVGVYWCTRPVVDAALVPRAGGIIGRFGDGRRPRLIRRVSGRRGRVPSEAALAPADVVAERI